LFPNFFVSRFHGNDKIREEGMTEERRGNDGIEKANKKRKILNLNQYFKIANKNIL